MIPLRKQARLAEDSSDKTRAEKTIHQLLSLLREHPQVRELFARFGVPLSKLDEIPIKFKKLEVSAKAKDGQIFLNENLLENGDLLNHAHYLYHELVHVLQQITGSVDDKAESEAPTYLDRPSEIEAFREQIRFISKYKNPEEAEKYLKELLDFHELKGSERDLKKKQLEGLA